MSTNWLSSNISYFLLCIVMLLASMSLNAQEVRVDTVYVRDTIYLDQREPVGYEKKAKRIINRWNKLIPRYSKIQFAGSMGLISLGTGWDYGKNKQWETDLFFGVVPRYSTKKTRWTITLKQNFIPWTIRLKNEKIRFKPFSTGLYLNTMFGEDYWGSAPSKYPNNYYSFSTKMRINIFIGQGWEYRFDTSKKQFCKSLTFFYEVSSNELYLINAVTNRHIKAKDFLGLSLGVKMQFL